MFFPYLFFPSWIAYNSFKLKQSSNLYKGINLQTDIIIELTKEAQSNKILWTSERQFKYKDFYYELIGLKYLGEKIYLYARHASVYKNVFSILKILFYDKINGDKENFIFLKILNNLFEQLFFHNFLSSNPAQFFSLFHQNYCYFNEFTSAFIEKDSPPPKSLLI